MAEYLNHRSWDVESRISMNPSTLMEKESLSIQRPLILHSFDIARARHLQPPRVSECGQRSKIEATFAVSLTRARRLL